MEKTTWWKTPKTFSEAEYIVGEIAKRRLTCKAGHAWRKPETLVKRVIEEEPMGIRPLLQDR